MTYDKAIELVQSQQYQPALDVLHALDDQDPTDWYPHYLAGQCHRFLRESDQSLAALERAVHLHPDPETQVLHACAVAQESAGRYHEALETLRRSLEKEPEHIPSILTLGIVRRRLGEYEAANETNETALQLIAFEHACALENSRDNPILEHEPWEQQFHLWMTFVFRAAMRLAAIAEVDGISTPTGESAERERRTQEHAGLYWEDRRYQEGNLIRHYFPNFFTTLRTRLQQDPSYAVVLGNRAQVLGDLGLAEETEAHAAEAEFFHSMQGS